MDLHHQFAARQVLSVYMYGHGQSYRYIVENPEGGYTLTSEEKDAATRYNRAGAARMVQDYLATEWNPTKGKPPEFEIVKVHRPAKIHHPW